MEACVASLRVHLLEKWETPEVLHGALAFVGETRTAQVPEAAHRVRSVLQALGDREPEACECGETSDEPGGSEVLGGLVGR